jgi:hypothetical protein
MPLAAGHALPALRPLRRLRQTPPRLAALALGGMALYLAAMRAGTGRLRPEQLWVCGAALLLVVWSDGSRRLLRGLAPFLLFGIAYDLTHLTQPLVRHLTVRVAEPYLAERRLFGLPTAAGRLIPSEWLALHPLPLLDLLTGTAYIVYVYWSIGLAAWLALRRPDPAGQRLLSRYGWTFLLLNLAGFATYYLYPAAPPWYVAAHGLGPADLSVGASAAGAARWDALTGIPYFAAFYGRSADVFGAIPSLHAAYPLFTFLYGRELRSRWLDAASLGLFLLTSFAAVYLGHHYLLDVLLGAAYALAAWGGERLLRLARGRRAGSAQG